MQDAVKEALELKRAGNYARAIALFEEAIESQGSTPFLLSNLGHSFLLAGDLVQARGVLEEAIARDPKNTFARSFLAGVAEKEGRAKEQIELLSEVVAISPDDLLGRVNLAWALLKSKKSKEALEHAEWLFSRAEPSPKAFKTAAAVFKAAGRLDDARAAFKKLLSISPNDGFAMKELLELGEGEKGGKLHEIENLLKLPANKANRELLFARVKYLESAGDVEAAAKAAAEIVAAFPDDIKVKTAFTYLLVRVKRYADALPLLGELLKLNPKDYYLHNTVLRCAKESGGLEGAYALYTELIREHPAEKALFGRRRRIQQMLEESEDGRQSKLGKDSYGVSFPQKRESLLFSGDPRFRGDDKLQDLHAELKRFFGFTSFRPGQEEVVRAIVAGQNTLAVMPTGRGKSLCFQLPALIKGGLSIVVSPLIALMKDQVDELSRRGFPSAALNSSLLPEDQDIVLKKALDGILRFLYVAPERFKVANFVDILPRLNPKFFIVDEAHCISQWGHDFRPDYLRLAKAISAAGRPQVVAMTATATPDVQQDIVKQIGVKPMSLFVAGFERPNLAFAIAEVSNQDERAMRLVELVKKTEGSAIIYTATRKAAQEAGDVLSNAGVKTIVYHAGLEHDERVAVQNAFMKGEVRAIAATNAFGMGIDKSDIRLVVHYQMPGSIEAYYQEAGRAGRDGRPARCELLYAFFDKEVHEFFIDASNPPPEVIRDVYTVLLGNGGDMVELSARSIALCLKGVSDMMVSNTLGILERMNVIERRPTGETPGRVEIRHAFLMKPPSEKAFIKKKVWQWINLEAGSGDRSVIDITPEVVAKELALDTLQVNRALNAMSDEGLISYSAPFRGRAVVIRSRIDPKDLPIDRKALAEKKRRDGLKLDRMIDYCKSGDCRQSHLIRYFGGKAEKCGKCDECGETKG